MIKNYLADTNIFVRFFVPNLPSQTKESERYLSQAKAGKIKIIVLSEIIAEIEYVLRKVYKIPKIEVVSKLLWLIKTDYLDVEKRNNWINAFVIYQNTNIDLIDSLLLATARNGNMEILSYDKDFKKNSV